LLTRLLSFHSLPQRFDLFITQGVISLIEEFVFLFINMVLDVFSQDLSLRLPSVTLT